LVGSILLPLATTNKQLIYGYQPKNRIVPFVTSFKYLRNQSETNKTKHTASKIKLFVCYFSEVELARVQESVLKQKHCLQQSFCFTNSPGLELRILFRFWYTYVQGRNQDFAKGERGLKIEKFCDVILIT